MPSQVDLPPGLELDRRVAELRGEDCCMCDEPELPDLDIAPGGMDCCGKWPAERYSTTWAAGILWDELVQRGADMTLERKRYNSDPCKCTAFYRDAVDSHTYHEAEGDTAPHAITLAWYAAALAKEKAE